MTAGRATGARQVGSYPNKEKGRFNVDNEIQDQADFAQNISIAISRRKAFAIAAKLGLGSAALAGGLGTGMAANPPEAGGGLPKKNYKFVYVCHLTSSHRFVNFFASKWL